MGKVMIESCQSFGLKEGFLSLRGNIKFNLKNNVLSNLEETDESMGRPFSKSNRINNG